METKITCPLGSECERVVGDHIERCAWYVSLMGKSPQDGTPINESRCAIAWQPILMIESNGVNHSIAGSIQSMRNQTIKRQDEALEAINNAQANQNTRLR